MNTAVAKQPAVGTNVATMSHSQSLVHRIAQRFSVDPAKLLTTLKMTAFRQRADKQTGQVREPSDEEMMALLILAETYRLNPFTKELFAFMDPKSGAIIPVVSVDGWIRIINEQPTLRSLSFTYSPETVKHKGKTCHEWMEIELVRSDRDKPIVIREYFAEVVRDVTFPTPWDTHPNRMHRHKTLIQGARVAFGFGGIYDEDEAHRIIDGEAARVPETAPAVAAINAAVTSTPANTDQSGERVFPSTTIEGEKVETGPEVKEAAELKTPPTLPAATVRERLDAALAKKSKDALDEAAAEISLVVAVKDQKALSELYKTHVATLEGDDGK